MTDEGGNSTTVNTPRTKSSTYRLVMAKRISDPVGEHLLVIAVPVALKALCRIVFALEPEEFRQLRITGFNLIAPRVTMVRQIVPAAALDPHVDEIAKRLGRACLTLRGVHDVESGDEARVRLRRPREKTLIILLDPATR